MEPDKAEKAWREEQIRRLAKRKYPNGKEFHIARIDPTPIVLIHSDGGQVYRWEPPSPGPIFIWC